MIVLLVDLLPTTSTQFTWWANAYFEIDHFRSEKVAFEIFVRRLVVSLLEI